MQNCYPRFNAGRPPLPKGARKVRITGSVPPAQLAWVIQCGGGNVSVGLRKAIAAAMQASAPEVVAAEIARNAAAKADIARVDADIFENLAGNFEAHEAAKLEAAKLEAANLEAAADVTTTSEFD
jgi:hypothetical protein